MTLRRVTSEKRACSASSELLGHEEISMPKNSASLKAVFYALGANGGIALAKAAAAFFTGSGAMLAEALHSLADCGNQVLLLVGMQQAKKLPTPDHPMGYGRVVYFWSMMVGVLLFSIGRLFSVWHGVQSLQHPEPVKYLLPSLDVLLVAVVLEAISLRGALKALAQERGDKSLSRWFRETRQSELLVITGEDIAALAGLALAFVALALTGHHWKPDFRCPGLDCGWAFVDGCLVRNHHGGQKPH